jgi:hypothetical protein
MVVAVKIVGFNQNPIKGYNVEHGVRIAVPGKPAVKDLLNYHVDIFVKAATILGEAL